MEPWSTQQFNSSDVIATPVPIHFQENLRDISHYLNLIYSEYLKAY